MAAPPATPESVARRTASIQDAIARVSSSAEKYAEISEKNIGDPSKAAETATVQNGLALDIRKLLREVQGPMGTMMELVGALVRTAALRSLLEMGVFSTLPADGTPMTVDDLLQKLEVPVEKALIVRLLRNASGPLVETDTETYAQTPFSAPLTNPDLVATFKHVIDECGPALVLLNEYFRANGFKQPEDPANSPYTFAHRTDGVESWAHISKFPDRQSNSNRAMKAQSFDGVWSVGLYPFAEKLTETPTDEATPLVVDVGGGAGHTSRKIKDLCAGVKGRVVLQDRAEVVADAPQIEGVESMAHDFFAPQPVKGARVYYLRRIFHDWADPSCIKILKQLADAMDPKTSRVVIAEQILPTEGVSDQSAMFDMVMMTMTGQERTEKQWHELLAQAGLKVEKFYKAPSTPFGAIEARLAG